ncbi:hypothetical protein, partial [Umezakia ovalisporum]|uniref:hypothetical protein n=1 Tax=Umezakia ovalisporum TaxID=75695 RepID=UPI0039C654CE
MKWLSLTIILIGYTNLMCQSQIRTLKLNNGKYVFLFNLVQGDDLSIYLLDGKNAIFLNNTTYFSPRLMNMNSNFDSLTYAFYRRNNYQFVQPIGYKSNHHYVLGVLPNSGFPTTEFPFGRAEVLKFNKFGRKIWDWNITPAGLTGSDYIWNGAYSVETDSSDKFWVLLNRFYSPNGGNVFHPVVMCLDTAGLMVQEYDVPVIEMSVGHQIVQVDANSFGIIGRELGPDTSQSVFWHVRKSPMQLLSKTYLRYTAERDAGEWDNTMRIAIGPGGKYFIHGLNRQIGQLATYPSNHIATMRDSVGGRVQRWQITDGWVNYAAFLQDGDLFCQVATDSGFHLRRYNPLTGTLLSNLFVPLMDTMGHRWYYNGYTYPIISDSGHFYAAINMYSRNTGNSFTRLYCLPNVGKVWKPWNNPTGLPSSKTALSLYAYPNPTSSRFKLRGYKEEEGLTLRLFNNSGKEV